MRSRILIDISQQHHAQFLHCNVTTKRLRQGDVETINLSKLHTVASRCIHNYSIERVDNDAFTVIKFFLNTPKSRLLLA